MDNEIYEKVYKNFSQLIIIILNKYTKKIHEKAVDDIMLSMKIIYKDNNIFKYVFERFYSNGLNPFLTAYSEFMNYKSNNNYELDNIFYLIADGILVRSLKEKITNNLLIVF
jgi:hypothetical protein